MSKLTWSLTFLLLSASGFYFLWVLILSSPGMSQLEKLCPVPYYPADASRGGSSSHQLYTGSSTLDLNLCALASFFIEAMKPEVYETTFSLLYGLPPVAIFPLVESMRGRAAGSIMPAIGPMIVGLAFQRVGGGVILPLYWMYMIQSDTATMRTRKQIDPRHATAILLSLAVTYHIPTYLMLKTQNPFWTAFWQPFPLYGAIGQLVGHLVLPRFSYPSGSSIVRGIYLISFAISAGAHIFLLYNNRDDVVGGVLKIFLPSPMPIMSDNLPLIAKNFLQWDNVFICGPAALLTFRFAETSKQMLGLILTYTAGSILLGPGSAIALVMIWRETKLMELQKVRTPKRI